MKRCSYVCIAIAMLFGAISANADIKELGGYSIDTSTIVWDTNITFYGNVDIEAYNELPSSDWQFKNLAQAAREALTLTVQNMETLETITGSVVQYGAQGNSGWHSFSATEDFFGISLRHNNAIQVDISLNIADLGGDFVNAMAFAINPHNNSFKGLSVTAYGIGTDGQFYALTADSKDTGGFFGFSIEDGSLFGLTIAAYGHNGNNAGIVSFQVGIGGGYIDDGFNFFGGGGGGDTTFFGDDTVTSATPEPATLLILGLGAVGAGFAVRRRTRQ